MRCGFEQKDGRVAIGIVDEHGKAGAFKEKS
jgi:hypothetical protein